MRAESANLNHCAVLFLSRAATNLCWYYYNDQLHYGGVKCLCHVFVCLPYTAYVHVGWYIIISIELCFLNPLPKANSVSALAS